MAYITIVELQLIFSYRKEGLGSTEGEILPHRSTWTEGSFHPISCTTAKSFRLFASSISPFADPLLGSCWVYIAFPPITVCTEGFLESRSLEYSKTKENYGVVVGRQVARETDFIFLPFKLKKFVANYFRWKVLPLKLLLLHKPKEVER